MVLDKGEDAKGWSIAKVERMHCKGGVAGAGKAALAVVAVAVARIGAAGALSVETSNGGLCSVGIGAATEHAPPGDGDHHQKENQRDASCGEVTTHGKPLSSSLFLTTIVKGGRGCQLSS